MKVDYVGKNIQVTDFIRDYTEHKLERLKPYLKEIDIEEDSVNIRVTYSFEKHRHRNRIDIDIYFNSPGGGVIHAWEESNDLYSAIDFVIDEVERQIVRLKARRKEEKRRLAKLQEKERRESIKEESIQRAKIVFEPMPLEKPMSVEDAMYLLEETGAFFFPFRNSETGEINVLYRRKAGNYGLIAPGV